MSSYIYELYFELKNRHICQAPSIYTVSIVNRLEPPPFLCNNKSFNERKFMN